MNNAGISWGEPVESMPLDKWRAVLETNVTGCFLMSQAVAGMIRSKRGGSIVNIASVAALVGTDPEILDAIGYTASKGAIVSMTRDLAVKWAQFGIRVNAIALDFSTRDCRPVCFNDDAPTSSARSRWTESANLAS